MTRDEILNMEAGREMDALIAEKVMGIELRHISDYTVTFSYYENGEWMQYGGCKCCGHAARPKEYCFRAALHYSESVSAAFNVVEKLKTSFHTFSLEYSIEFPHWNCVIIVEYEDDSKWYSCNGDTAPLAICRAALLATMVTD